MPTEPEIDPLQGEEWFLRQFVWEMVQPVPTKAFLQPAKTAAMCMAFLEYTHLPHVLLLAQNLALKWIAPSDKMWRR